MLGRKPTSVNSANDLELFSFHAPDQPPNETKIDAKLQRRAAESLENLENRG